MNVRFWRKWHRWIGFPAAIFLFFAATTGFLVAFTEFFGADEALREATRALISQVTVSSPATAYSDPVARAMAGAARISPVSPIDQIQVQFKGKQPTVTIFTGKPTGGEDRKLTFDANTGALIKNEEYADKPFLYRLHSGEAFGDGGLVVAMFWALALAILAASGVFIYFTMRGKRERTGIKKVFW
ncbi:MAG: PepSY-associated TM helix domain-containing protein [Gemmatimonadaceae bacterium]